MTREITKHDVAEFLSDELDATQVEGLGFVLAGIPFDEEGAILIQTWPNEGDKESVDFLLRVTRYRQPRIEGAK